MQIKLKNRVPKEGCTHQQESEEKLPIHECCFDQQMQGPGSIASKGLEAREVG